MTIISSGVLSKMISNYTISYIALLIVCMGVPFLWYYIIYKLHVEMHDYEIEYTHKESPYDKYHFNIGPIKDLLSENHRKHHLQKGEKKGNYNMIALGADEWFGYNIRKIDNKEYCKSHTDEKICNT